MADLIYSRTTGNTFLTADQVAYRAPAAFATSVDNRLSEKYGNFNSAEAIDIMRDRGYLVTQAAQVKSRTANAAHGQHLLAFGQAGISPGYRDERPEIVFYNSHDGRSSMRLFAGVYRFICSNGIVAGEGFDQRMTHYASNLDSFEHLLNHTISMLQDVSAATDNMKRVETSKDQRVAFAEQALALRFDDARTTKLEDRKRPGFDSLTIDLALSAMRLGDTAPDAWTVFNRVQESVMRAKGNGYSPLMVRGKRTVRGYTFDGHKEAKPLTAIKQVVDVNRQLWDLAQDTLVAA